MKSIVVGTDGSPNAEAAVRQATEVAKGSGARLVGARGVTAIRRFLLGSVSSKLAHHAHCSLMIVRED